MRNSLGSKIIVLGALCCVFSTACSSGGGGGMSQVASTGTSTSMTTTTVTNVNCSDFCSDTGIAGSVAAPAAATFATAPPQLANPGGPTFNGSSGYYPANVTFPLLINGLQQTSTGLSPTPADPAATVTVINYSASSSTIQLVIPSAGINQTTQYGANLTYLGNGPILSGFSYVTIGSWGASPSSANPTGTGPFVFGFETPPAAMPTSGTATITGGVSGTVYKTIGIDIQSGVVAGNASMSVNFASGAINGSFTQMTFPDGAPGTGQWNDVSVTANLATGSNRFNGTTAAASAPGTAMSLSGSAVGKINGAFFGPAAQQVGAIWSLSDGTGSALGTLVAGH